jgi:predicted SprT family Zn-dependent metalloprotease
MTTPQQQIIDKCKTVFAKAKELYGLDMSQVGIHFDLKGRAAGMACRRGNQYFMRFNRDMLTREAFDHIINDTVPHEIAHCVCFMNRALGSNHDAGWARVCRALGGTGDRTHSEEVVYGKGHTYEYTTDRGHKVRMGDRHHATVQRGIPLRYKNNKGTVTKECAYSIVGVQGRTLAAPIVKVAAKVVPVQAIIPASVPVVNPLVTAARGSYTIGVAAPTPRTPATAMPAGASKASMARAIMLAGHTRGETYENVITAIMRATGHDRQLARATYRANCVKVGIPVQ